MVEWIKARADNCCMVSGCGLLARVKMLNIPTQEYGQIYQVFFRLPTQAVLLRTKLEYECAKTDYED